MYKKEIVKKLAEMTNLTNQQAEDAFEALLCLIEESLVMGNAVRIHKFGTFKIRNCKARTCRNPYTGASVAVPAKKKVVFSPSNSLKDGINR